MHEGVSQRLFLTWTWRRPVRRVWARRGAATEVEAAGRADRDIPRKELANRTSAEALLTTELEAAISECAEQREACS